MNKILNSFLLALVFGASFSAHADTASGTIAVSTTVSNSCFLAAPGTFSFGNYDPTALSSIVVNSSMSLRCTKGATVSIGMDKGLNSSAGSSCSSPGRQLANGSNFIPYSIFSPTGFDFGCSADNVYNTTSASGTTVQNITYKGRITRGWDVPAGSYTDTITVTVSF